MLRSPHPGEGCCLPHSPWTVRVGGSPIGGANDNGYTGLVFSAANPCGATVNDLGLTGPQFPLEVLARWSGCIGSEEPRDGELVLVRTSVVARFGPQNPIDFSPINPCGANVGSRLLDVKIAIRACGMPEPVIVDAGSELIVPAGPATIEVLAPGEGPNAAGWIVGKGRDEVETPWTQAVIRIAACPCDCGYEGRATLTEAFTQDENFDQVILVTPRRAREVVMGANTAGGAAALVNATKVLDPAGANRMGTYLFAATAIQTPLLVGAEPYYHVQIGGGAGVGRIGVVWRIV